MARIAETELQHLKAAVALAAVAQSQGRQLITRGRDLVTLCPFHHEKTPSCCISPAKNLYHCFGCNAGGSVLDWVMHTEKLSLRKAVERLRSALGENPAVAPLVTQHEPEMFAEDEAGRQLLLGRVVDFYHHTLLNAPEAVAYLEKRRLNHPELVAQFRLGFANRTLAYRLPAKKVQAGEKIANRLAHEILGRTLDEMPPQTRSLLLLIQKMVGEAAAARNCKPGAIRFTRREIRDFTQWSDNQLKVHCVRLAEMEYLLVHGGSRGHLLQYELLWDGGGVGAHLCGLIEPDEQPAYDPGKLGSDESRLPLSCPGAGARLG